VSDKITCFFNELHSDVPASPEVYIDWQKQLGQDDVKDLLVTALARSRQSGVATQMLVTGQKGSGKTTELHRVRERLRAQNVFVSFQDGQFVESLGSDVTASDILYFAAEQLVIDLKEHNIVTAGAAWNGFWSSLKDQLGKLGVDLKGPLGVGIGLSLKNETSRRSDLRKLFDAQRNRFIDMVNTEILQPATKALKETGFGGITLIVDGLGDIPLRSIEDPLLATKTNHEQIFIEQGDVLRGLQCDLVYTFPIELAYQGLRLGNQAGGEAQELGIIPICSRAGASDERGREALHEMLSKRAAHCGASLDEFIDPADTIRLIEASGGHIRTLFQLTEAAINRVLTTDDSQRLAAKQVTSAIIRRADTLQKGLLQVHRQVLDQVAATQQPPIDELRPRFTELLFSQHVLAYFDDRGTWYAPHPLTDRARLA
jgi:hypothetical protein